MSAPEAMSRAALAMAAISAASAATVDLAEALRDDDFRLQLTETVETMADAARLTIEVSGRAGSEPEVNQLLGALTRFLEGGA